MNRQAKTPRTRLELAQAELARVFGVPTDWGCRRQPKGKRAKSGQWWHRHPVHIDPDDVRFFEEVRMPRPPVKTLAEMRTEAITYGTASIHQDDVEAEVLKAWSKNVMRTPSGRSTLATDTSAMEAIRRFNA